MAQGCTKEETGWGWLCVWTWLEQSRRPTGCRTAAFVLLPLQTLMDWMNAGVTNLPPDSPYKPVPQNAWNLVNDRWVKMQECWLS